MVVQPWRMRDENPSEANASERRLGFERRNIVHHDVSIESKYRRRHFSEQHRLNGVRSTHTKCVYHAYIQPSFRRRKLAALHSLNGMKAFPPPPPSSLTG